MSSSTRPAPPSVHLTPAQRAALLHQTSPVLHAASPPTAAAAAPQLPAPAGLLVGRSPSGHIMPKRVILKTVTAQGVEQSAAYHIQQQANGASHQPPHSSTASTISGTTLSEAATAQTAKPDSTTTQPIIVNSSVATSSTPATPVKVTPSISATASPTSSGPPSPSSRPPPQHSSAQLPEPTPSASPRVAAHQLEMLEALHELVHTAGVGHWQGLTTQARKDIAQKLCQEHLFNPQPGNGKDSRTTVVWQTQASWTDYDIWVTCTRNVSPYYQGETAITTYTAHFDQVGRLVETDTRESKGKKNCVIQ